MTITPTPPLSSPILINDLLGIAQIIGALATGGALWVTYFTLKEMRHQTKLANDPILKIRYRLRDSNKFYTRFDEEIVLEHEDEAPYKKWLSCISDNLHQDLSGLQDKIFYLEFTNGGKSEITHISIDYSFSVEMLDNNGVLPVPFQPTIDNYQKDFIIELGEKSSAILPIVRIKYFPKFKFSILKLIYKDIRKNSFNSYDGEPTYNINNDLLIPIIEKTSDDNDSKNASEDIPF